MLTVSDILGLEELDLTLVGGSERVSAPVRWVHSSELADPTPWLRGSELLLTIGRPLEDAPERFVELLAESGLAGLGLGLGFGFEECPAEARTAADRLGFPVFTIPYEIPFIAITEAVFTGLSNQRVAETERSKLLGNKRWSRQTDSRLLRVLPVGSAICARRTRATRGQSGQ